MATAEDVLLGLVAHSVYGCTRGDVAVTWLFAIR